MRPFYGARYRPLIARVIWINGAFGAGKTSAAELLARRRPGSLVLDPEPIGEALRSALPAEVQAEDFQDLPVWRDLTVAFVRSSLARYGREVIVPMTLAV